MNGNNTIRCANAKCVFFRDNYFSHIRGVFVSEKHCKKSGAHLDTNGKCKQFIPVLKELEKDHKSLNMTRNCWQCGRPGTIPSKWKFNLDTCPSCDANNNK